MKKNIIISDRIKKISWLPEGSYIFYQKYKTSINLFINFIIDNNLKKPHISFSTSWDEQHFEKIEELNFYWNFELRKNKKILGEVLVDHGIFENGTWSYFARIIQETYSGESTNNPLILPFNVLEILKDN